MLLFRESSAKDQIELQRIRNLLDNERSKLQQLEQCRNATQKSGRYKHSEWVLVKIYSLDS